jgi:uncharacterized protein (DUF4213/DUF364 family)
VRAIHLPPVAWTGTKAGEFAAVELDSGAIGLSYVLLDDTLAALAGLDGARLVGSDALALARLWRDGQGAERTLGFAAVNALSRHLLDQAGTVPPTATDSIGGLVPTAGERIGMVGFFPPLVRQIADTGARLTVVELRADLAGAHPGFEMTLDPAALQACPQVLMTSTVLLNDSLDPSWRTAAARAVAMVGPGAGCLPQPLFARGVTLLGGSWVRDVPAMLAALREGTSWSPSAYKFALAPSDLPADLRSW